MEVYKSILNLRNQDSGYANIIPIPWNPILED